MSKIRLRFSPYMYARVSAMKSLLLKPEDYDRLTKMGPNEIARFLLDAPQYPEILDISAGPLSVEEGLNKHLSRVYEKLYLIADGNLKKVIGTYLLRFDMENIKAIVRSKFAKLPLESVEPLLYPSINYDGQWVKSLLAKDTAKEVISALPFKLQVQTDSLFEIENALDKYYVNRVLEFAESLRGQGKIISQFMREEIDALNIRTIMRLRAEDMNNTEIEQYLIKPSEVVLKLLEKQETADMISFLRKHKRTRLSGEEGNLLERLEIDLDVALLKKESLLMHKNPLTVDQILGFMFAKQIEVRNLKTLIKGKQLDIPQEYMEQLLVVAA